MKKLVFTHGIDIDGYGCAILARYAWGDNVDIIYADNFDLDDKFVKLWGMTKFADYDEIFVTDHCFGVPLCHMVDRDKKLRGMVKVFDHHSSRVGAQDQFDWVNIVVEKDNKKQSGTSLFYEYLCEQNLLGMSENQETWMELTRLYDTWEWTKTNNLKANALNTLSLAVGREEYIRRMSCDHFLTDPFEFTQDELRIIDKYNEDFIRQVAEYVNQIKIIDFAGAKAGYVEIKDVYKNDISSGVREADIGKQISFLLMPIRDRKTVSLRNVDPDFDVSVVASQFGGGGHKGAASFPLQNLPEIDIKDNRDK